jgi:hypothetical protein
MMFTGTRNARAVLRLKHVGSGNDGLEMLYATGWAECCQGPAAEKGGASANWSLGRHCKHNMHVQPLRFITYRLEWSVQPHKPVRYLRNSARGPRA